MSIIVRVPCTTLKSIHKNSPSQNNRSIATLRLNASFDGLALLGDIVGLLAHLKAKKVMMHNKEDIPSTKGCMSSEPVRNNDDASDSPVLSSRLSRRRALRSRIPQPVVTSHALPTPVLPMRQDAYERMISHTLELEERIDRFIATDQPSTSTETIPSMVASISGTPRSSLESNNFDHISSDVPQDPDSDNDRSEYRATSEGGDIDEDRVRDKPPSYRSMASLVLSFDEGALPPAGAQEVAEAVPIANHDRAMANMSIDSVTPSEILPAYSPRTNNRLEVDLEAHRTEHVRLNRLTYVGNRIGSPAPSSSMARGWRGRWWVHKITICVSIIFFAIFTVLMGVWGAGKMKGDVSIPNDGDGTIQARGVKTGMDVLAVLGRLNSK